MAGWIKIYREIQGHWIWNDPSYLKAWICIIMTVNYENKRVLIGGELIECDRGQSVLSLEGWAKTFGKKWTIQRVRTFFDLLTRDQMVTTEGLRKTTRLTVCNYNDYQDLQQGDNTEKTSTEQTSNRQVTTTKEGEEVKKERNKEIKRVAAVAAAAAAKRKTDFYNSLIPFLSQYPKEMIKAFYEYWTELNKSGVKMRFELEKTWENPKRLGTWAKREKIAPKNLKPIIKTNPQWQNQAN